MSVERLSPRKRKALTVAGLALAVSAPLPLALGVVDGMVGHRSQLETQAVIKADQVVKPVSAAEEQRAEKVESAYLDSQRNKILSGATLPDSVTFTPPQSVRAAHATVQRANAHRQVLFEARRQNGAEKRADEDKYAEIAGIVLTTVAVASGSVVGLYRLSLKALKAPRHY